MDWDARWFYWDKNSETLECFDLTFLFKWLLWAKILSQKAQENRFSPVWATMWFLMWELNGAVLEQNGQAHWPSSNLTGSICNNQKMIFFISLKNFFLQLVRITMVWMSLQRTFCIESLLTKFAFISVKNSTNQNVVLQFLFFFHHYGTVWTLPKTIFKWDRHIL